MENLCGTNPDRELYAAFSDVLLVRELTVETTIIRTGFECDWVFLGVEEAFLPLTQQYTIY